MSDYYRSVADTLRRARKTRGVSQDELSKQLGISQRTLSRAETTTTDIRCGTLQQIARALDLEPMLVPRRLVPAVDAVVRHGMSSAPFAYDLDDGKPYNEAYDELSRGLTSSDKGRKSGGLERRRHPVFISIGDFSMSKIMSGFLTLCMVAALGAGAQADNDKMHGHGAMGGMGMGHMHRCPPGKHWVKGYTNKNGKHVKGYCR